MKDTLRVLIADDSADDAALVLRELRRAGYEVNHRRVQTSEDLKCALATASWDVVLCDYSMPGFDAPRAIAAAREAGWCGPFLVVSGTIGEEKAVECMRLGAQDLVLKDRLARLVPAVERELDAHARRVEQTRTREKLARVEETLVRTEKLRIIGQMTAGISHDLRNLLQPISLYAELTGEALDEDDTAHARECLDDLKRVVQRGLELVNRLREFSRPSADGAQQSVELDRVAREALAVMKPRARSAERAVVLRDELASPPAFSGEMSVLVSAIVNLLTNALDAGAQTITLRTGGDAVTVWIEVADDGAGMSSEVKARLFEPFFTTKGEQGTGLGLAMVHAAALRYDGSVELDSAPGCGTRVRLMFPVSRSSLSGEPLRGTPSSHRSA